ncbi:UDP-3-O-(3-hydroxymyristoyl)glucosamine N-acyltransferase [candidate division KSB1 bacterium]|nr:UDP-3-O-(3-hydroxymyristoyl)glucosamine N-acyltransferase [candidate division KSB1 bacterium]
MQFTIQEIAKLVNGQVDGGTATVITGIAKIEDAGPGELSFISNPKYAKFLDTTQASAVLVNKDFPATQKTVIRTENAYVAFLTVLRTFYPDNDSLHPGIHPSAVIEEYSLIDDDCAIGPFVYIGKNCTIGGGTRIHPGVVIGENVTIGEDTILYPNVTIREHVTIGNNVIIHNGTVVGSDGFGFAREGDIYHKIPQVGTVVIEDNVEIGSNCSIDRATLGETRIKKGVKLDNLIQVAHNVVIGENTVIAAQSGISGSTKVGKAVVMGGQVGIAGHIDIGDNVTIGAQSGVSKGLRADQVYFGYPARPIMQAKREEAAMRRLPELIKRVAELERMIKEMKDGG